ncbi:hypothetical protein D9756_001231 [Leucocoprinus leucothites]|uniref:F-box domain-containing protein n=1 Tax=Leucocoprinus leucothites TaxID=201217 RepID=A0A8H5G4T2_9AGAR|nr:hypothetical protein D9756_001231 [Leucoagaricus leucothites]
MDILPDEIISDAFQLLDYSSLLAARLSCKRFYGITKSRQIWLNLLQNLKEDFGYVIPDGDNSYSDDELERWVSRRYQVAYKMDMASGPSGSPLKFEIRDVSQLEMDLGQAVVDILPGGRWLMFSNGQRFFPGHMPMVFLLDMEVPPSHSNPMMLYDSRPFSSGEGLSFFDMRYWIDRSKPQLSLLLASCLSREGLLRNCITRVELAGHGSHAIFHSQPHATIKYNLGSIDPEAVALNDRWFVVVEKSQNAGHSIIRIMNYSAVIGDSDYPTVEYRQLHFADLPYRNAAEFVHENILVLLSQTKLYVFEVVDSNTSSINIHQLHCVPVAASFTLGSPFRHYPGFSRATVYEYNHSFSTLVVLHDKSKLPTILKTEKEEFRDTGVNQRLPGKMEELIQGLSWSVTYDINWRTDILESPEIVRHEWDLATSQFKKGWKSQAVPLPRMWPPPRNLLAFSEEVGRLVLLRAPDDYSKASTITVVDII